VLLRWSRAVSTSREAASTELEELGLPREISVAPGTEATDHDVPVDAHAPHVVGHAASERFDERASSPHCASASQPIGYIIPFTQRTITPDQHKRNAFHSSAYHALSRACNQEAIVPYLHSFCWASGLPF